MCCTQRCCRSNPSAAWGQDRACPHSSGARTPGGSSRCCPRRRETCRVTRPPRNPPHSQWLLVGGRRWWADTWRSERQRKPADAMNMRWGGWNTHTDTLYMGARALRSLKEFQVVQRVDWVDGAAQNLSIVAAINQFYLNDPRSLGKCVVWYF